MTFIAILNAARHYLERKHAERALRHMDPHVLRDIGFYRDNGQVRPLAGAKEAQHGYTAVPEADRIRQAIDG